MDKSITEILPSEALILYFSKNTLSQCLLLSTRDCLLVSFFVTSPFGSAWLSGGGAAGGPGIVPVP